MGLRIGHSLLAAVAALSLSLASAAFAWADNAEPKAVTTRAIAIAYDNSSSMVFESDKWCNAKYSLEVLAAMMDSGDELALFTMESAGQKLLVDGASGGGQRVQQLHDLDLGVSNHTEPRTAREACDWLEGSDADEKYLIITTDGEFDRDGRLADVQAVVDEASAEGITTIYLAIGAEADTVVANAENVIIKKASSENILDTMVDVANQVFGRAKLSPDMFDQGSDVLKLEVPMSTIVVFAQGADVHVGVISQNDASVSSPEIAPMSYAERPTAIDSELTAGFKVNTDLKGAVATFNGEFPRGDYRLGVDGASTIEVYYQPDVGIAVHLQDDAGLSYDLEAEGENTLTAGTYAATFSFVDPQTGEPLESELLNPAVFSLVVDDGAEKKVVAEGEPLELSQGVVSLRATAETPGGGRSYEQYQNVQVLPPVGELLVSLEQSSPRISIDALDEPLTVMVAKQSGEALTEEEWQQCSLVVEDEFGLPWTAERTDERGVFHIAPGYGEGGKEATSDAIFGMVALEPRAEECRFVAAVNNDESPYRGAATETVTFEPNLLGTFLRWLPWLLLILLVLAIALLEALKPRLPRLRPTIELDDGEVHPLMYNRNNVRHRFWPPWTPESTSFVVDIQGYAGQYELSRRFALGEQSVGLKAQKRKNGKRRFGFDQATLDRLKAQQEGDREHPDPEYSFLSTNTFAAGSGFNVEGNVKGKRSKAGCWVPSGTYRIRF